MPSVSLTARNLRTLRPRPDKPDDVYFDREKSAPPGFALQVSASGARTFFLIYRSPLRHATAPKVWLSLGSVGRVSLKAARQAAREARGLIERGLDPKAERDRRLREARERPRLAGLVRQFLDATEASKSQRTIREHRRILKAEIEGSTTGKTLAAEVSREAVRALLDPIVKRGAGVMANRTLALLGAALGWGVNEGLIPVNPCRGMAKPHVEEAIPDEERVLSDPDIVKLWRGLDPVDGAGARRVNPASAAYVRVLLLTGTRRSETALAEWQHVHLGDAIGAEDVDGEPLGPSTWMIPPANRKGRRGKKRGLVLPLSTLADEAFLGRFLSVRGAQPDEGERADDPRIFGAAGRAAITNPHRFVKALREATGVDFSLHDLRATCATGCGNLGALPYVVSVILGHASRPGAAPVTARYDRADREPEVRKALQAWSDHIEGLLRKARKTA